MTELNLMSPEAEELLREIAADSRSSLLRVPRRGRGQGAKLVTLSDAGFEKAPGRSRSPAERRLAEVQRSEVARVLREVCSSRLVNDDSTRQTINPHFYRGAVKSALHSSSSDGPVAFYDEDVEEALGLLRLNEGLPGLSARPSVNQLATLAHKLSPHPTSQLQIAFDLSHKGQTQTAKRLLKRMSTNNDVRAKASALEASGFCWALEGNPGRAFEDFFAAYRLGSPRPSSLLSALANAIDWGDETLVRTTARLVDDFLSAQHPAVVHFIQSHAERKREGTWKTTERGRAIARNSAQKYGSISTEFLLVYSQ